MSVKWAIVDGWTVTGRDLAHWARQPFPAIVNLAFPVMVLLMFGYLFGGAMTVPGGGDYREFLVPGMLGLTMAFGVEATFTAVSTDAARGVTDRFRSMPMAPSAVVVGRSVADMLNSAVSLVVLIACGLLMGWRWHNGFAAALGAVGLLLLLRFAFVWLGVYLGLLLKRPEAVMALQILVWPIGFLSNVFISPEAMPSWLGVLAEWNPISATVSAARGLFGNPGWAGEHPVLPAVLWPLILIAVFFPLSVRLYQRLGS
jgi:ABC-2 type transport system permease protein